MLFNKNRLVIFSKGRYAGCKAVVLNNDADSKSIVVTGIYKAPKKIEEGMSERSKARRNKMIVFVKKMNPKHLIVTRYDSQLDFEGINIENAFEDINNKREVSKSCESIFRKAFEDKKEKWLFTKLKY